MTKLTTYGFSGKVLTWIQSFLTGRKQRVVVMGHESAWEWIVSGIPQRSVLGPILFLIYINDIVNNIECNTYLFADDMKILVEYQMTDISTNYSLTSIQSVSGVINGT